MHFSALRSLTQPLLDCTLYLTLIRYPYDPGTLASSANRCILGKVYLRFNLSSKQGESLDPSIQLGLFPASVYRDISQLNQWLIVGCAPIFLAFV